MTYCVALRLNRGLVFAADTRTSAGNDNVAIFRKLSAAWSEALRSAFAGIEEFKV
jgi:putative proteasome-type protease